jgi:hypothetical protein
VRDGEVMIDLQYLRKVLVDPEMGVALVEPGALWADLDAATHPFQLATTGGIVSHTGVFGLVLGGGIGWLMGISGLACDSLIKLEVLDEYGVIHVIDGIHPDLAGFRGSGREAGLVLSMDLRLTKIPPLVSAGTVLFRLDQFASVCSSLGAAMQGIPDELSVSPSLICRDGVWQGCADFVSTLPLSTTDNLLCQVLGIDCRGASEAKPYKIAQTVLDDELRFGRRNYWKSVATPILDGPLGAFLVEQVLRSPSTTTMISIDCLHGAATREPVGGSTASFRNSGFIVLLNTSWYGAENDQANIGWATAAHESMCGLGGVSRSTYGNYLSLGDEADADSSVPRTSRSADKYRLHSPESSR